MPNPDPQTPNTAPSSGFSLLEVILALAILVGAMAVLGELARHGLESARIARDTTLAQLLCESKLAEIMSGVVDPEPVGLTSFGAAADEGDVEWLYAIDIESMSDQGLATLRVTVTQDMPPERHPVVFSVVRWIPDPNVDLSEEEKTEESSDSESKSTGGGS
jgi:general secretion pathway protein I